MKSELQKVLDKVSEGSLLLDKSREELGKLQTTSDKEAMIRKIFVDRLSFILSHCVILMSDLSEVVESKGTETPYSTVEGWNEDFN